MSGLIKSDSAMGLSAVRPLPRPTAADTRPSPEEDERRRLRQHVSALEKELAQRDLAITRLRDDVDEAHRQGKAAGYQSGLADAETRDADRLAALEKAMTRAAAELKESLSSLERLSTLLARDGLDMVLGDPDYRGEILAKIIAAEVAKIEKSALVEIRLSQEDFADEGELSDLAKRVGVAPTMLLATDELSSGGCVMKLRLGQQEIGLRQQWSVLRARLEELAAPEVIP